MEFRPPGLLYAGLFFILLCIFPLSGINAAPQLKTIDTPTAATLAKGGYSIGIWGYDNGGIFTRALMGIHDSIFLGVSFDTQNLIGSGAPVFNIPGVIGRIKITDGFDDFPLLIAVGYDAFYGNDSASSLRQSWTSLRMIYGPYVVFTKPLFLLKHEQSFNLGLRTPIQPVARPEDTSLFLSLNFPIGQFIPMFEIERIFFSVARFNEILFNIGFRYELYDDFAIELNLLMTFNQPASRVLTFEYVGAF
ncbi:MAG: hypothetical protein OEV66_00425 [Spirochaetia bacterium]|nr:hypothetical protein [Spirochaetia bacterium]